MRLIESHHRFLLLVPMLAVLALAAAPALQAQSSAAPGAAESVGFELPLEPDVPLAPQEIRIAGSTLKPRINNVNYSATGGGACTYATSGNAATVWNTPLYLPDGATVNFLRVYYNDTSASDLFAWFTVYDLFGNIVDEWSATSTGSGGTGFNDSVAINHTIDYSLYSYVVNYRPVITGTSLQFCGVRIFYDD